MCARLGAVFAIGLAACGAQGSDEPEASASGPIWFEEVAGEVGLDFQHVSGLVRRFWFPENMGGGVGLCDYDGDGRLDVYLVQGGDLVQRDGGTPANRLFRNTGGAFVDVTDAAGVGDRGYGMGVACADFDADGDTDLYVTNVGPNALYRNEGDGTFTDVTASAGVGDDGWGASAVFTDYDGDGALDLFVVNYVNWDPQREIECFAKTRDGEREYCPPIAYDAPAPDVLYRGRGDGTFADVTAQTGIDRAFGNGLGVASADFDGDGRVDFFVANDATPNQLWLQTAAGRFEDRALRMGCALSGVGQAEAGMGVQAVDVEADGDVDLFLAHLRAESNTVYLLEGGLFHDRTSAVGVAAASRKFTGFGLGLCDFDHDGILDLFVANGRVTVEDPIHDPEDPYAEPNQLFRGEPGFTFREVAPRGGTRPVLVATSRAAAFGDLDDDGDVDVVVVNRDGPAHLLRNVAGENAAWIRFRVVDERGVDALGAVVTLRAGEREQSRLVQTAYSYLASNDPRVHFGLGPAGQADAVRVRWPDGREEAFGGRSANAEHVLRRGGGR